MMNPGDFGDDAQTSSTDETEALSCSDVLTYLSDYIDKNLDHDLNLAAEEHLATCNNCSIVLDSTQKAIVLYRQQQRSLTIPRDRHIKLYEKISDLFANRDKNHNDI